MIKVRVEFIHDKQNHHALWLDGQLTGDPDTVQLLKNTSAKIDADKYPTPDAPGMSFIGDGIFLQDYQAFILLVISLAKASGVDPYVYISPDSTLPELDSGLIN